jgi:uncharacterized protein involved in exopolysaccharide biosynthesis
MNYVEAPAPPTPASPADGDSESLIRGIFEPPEGFAFRAIGRHKRLIALFAVVGALVGAVFGLATPATYEAAATLQVGQVNPNSPGFASFTQSSSSLATAYSRAIAAAPVLAKVKTKLHLPPPRASARLSSEPIPLSPAFRVIATGPSAKQAQRLANVAAAGVIAYTNHSNSANPEATSLLSDYRRAALAFNRASARAAALAESSSDAALKAEAAKSAAKIRLKAVGNAYVATVGSQPPREGFVSFLAGATTATSDRSSKVQLYGFLGLLGGLVLGCGAALLRERKGGGGGSGRPGGPAPQLKPRPT